MLPHNAQPVDRQNSSLLIYETTHHESLPAMLDLSCFAFNRVCVYITQNSYDHLAASAAVKKWPGVSFVIQSKNISNRKFIRRLFTFARKDKFTHLHISTLDHNLLYFALLSMLQPELEISLSVQAINTYKKFIYRGFRNMSETFAKYYLHRRIKHLRVFAPAMVSAARSAFPSAASVYIPSRFFEGLFSINYQRGQVFKIVVPGTIDARRRDYGFVLETLAIIISDVKKEKIELVLLGNSSSDYGSSVIENFTSALSEHLNVKYYRNYISQQEYESQLGTADLIWGPVRINTSFEHTEEIYGQSTATGLTGDLLLNSIPAIVPSGFVVPEWYDHALLTYSSIAECAALIVKLIQYPDEMSRIRKDIEKDFMHITKAEFADAFNKLMDL